MAKIIDDCTPIEIARYGQAYLAAWDSVNDAALCVELKLNDQNLVDFSERLELERELSRLKAERALLEAKRQGFRARLKAIRPPKKAKLEKAQSLANDIDKLIKNRKTIVKIVEVADQAIKLFNSIQSA